MKIAHLASGFGVCLWLMGCGMQRAPEASAPSAGAAPTTPTPSAEERAAVPESPAAAPAPPPPAAPQGLDEKKSNRQKDESEFSSLEDAERALNQAKADLDRLALAEPEPALSRKSDSKPARAPSAAAPKASNVCEDACRAFSSLTRAANAVCRLDGSKGSHCSRAKQVLEGAQQRVASCSCPTAD